MRNYLLFLCTILSIGLLANNNDPRNATLPSQLLACMPPAFLEATDITSSTAVLSWTPNDLVNDTLFDIEVLPVASIQTTIPTASNISNNYLLSMLVPDTEYKFYIRTNCAPDSSIWVGPVHFKTAHTNPTACNFDLTIFDHTESNIKIDVSSAPGDSLGTNVFLKEVQLIIQQEWLIDLKIMLISPQGVISDLVLDRGGSNDHLGNPFDASCTETFKLSEEICSTVPLSTNPFRSIDTYLPEESFSNFYDNSDPNGIWTLVVGDDGVDDGDAIVKFTNLVFKPLSCVAPTNINVTNITANSVDISWTPTNCNGNIIIEYGPPGFVPGNGLSANEGTVFSIPCTTNFTLTGLNQLTDYDFYVREECGDFSYLDNSCLYSFITDCAVSNSSLLEDFDMEDNCSPFCQAPCPISSDIWSNLSSNDLDWRINDGTTTSGGTGPSDDISIGGKYIYLEASIVNPAPALPCSDSLEAILISDCILVDASSGDCHFSFYYHMYGPNVNFVQLEITTDGGISWTSLWLANGNKGDEWFKQYIDLSAYHNQTVQFRFVGKTGSGSKGDIALDEIEFYGSTLSATDTYFADDDGDGFGDPDDSLRVCFIAPPPGFVLNNLDCDDTNSAIHPDAIEILCNLIDENCNGYIDDTIFTNPIIITDTICVGETATLTINNSPFGKYYWFAMSNDSIPIDSGNVFVSPPLTDTTIYFAQDSLHFMGQSCKSDKIPVTIIVHPNPNITNATGDLDICENSFFDLNTIVITNNNTVNNNLSYHFDAPVSAATELASPNVQILSDTVFYIQATSINGCTDTVRSVFQTIATPTPFINAPDTLEVCYRGAAQLIDATEGGTGIIPLTYQWSTGATTNEAIIFTQEQNTFTNISVSITGANGCVGTDSVTVHTLNSIGSATITNITNPGFCTNDGAISIAPTDGLSPYTYTWEGPINGNANNITDSFTIDDLIMGAYTITIADATGCSRVLPQIIVNGPDIMIDSIVDASCFGQNNGGIFISISGLGLPAYEWKDNSTTTIAITEDLTNASAGIYSVIVTDDADPSFTPCALDGLEIGQPDSLRVVELINTSPSCAGESDATINLSIEGGITPYSFDWDNAPDIEDPINLTPDTFAVLITDNNGCNISDTTVISPTPPLDFLISTKSVSCFGGNDGSIGVIVSGGTPPFTYLWDDPLGQETAIAFGLTAGIYTVTITDVNDCLTIATDTVTQPNLLTATALTTPATCNTINDGRIDLVVSGGTSSFTYFWSDSSTNSNLVNILADYYALTITDDNNCVFSIDSILVDAPDLLHIPILTTQPTCIGVDDGMIDLSNTSGGTPPYKFEWNNSDSTAIITNLTTGNFVCNVSDTNGCSGETDLIEIIAPQRLDTSYFSFTQSNLCYKDTIASIFLEVESNSSSSNPYSFDIPIGNIQHDNGDAFALIDELPAGEFTVTISDNDGCFLEIPFSITQPNELTAEIEIFELPSCNNEEDGSLFATVNGGSEEYTYNWIELIEGGISSPREVLSGIGAGLYVLEIRDTNNCYVSDSIIISEPSSIDVTVFTTPSNCIDNNSGTANITISGGEAPYAIDWDIGFMDTTFIDQLEAGLYYVTVTDSIQCSITTEVTVEFEENGLIIDTINVVNPSCSGSADGKIVVTVTGGSGTYDYNWSIGDTASFVSANIDSIINLPSGSYSVTVTNLNEEYLCTGEINNILLTNPPALSWNLESMTNELACYGDETGHIHISVSEGTPPYTYMWNTGDTTQDINGLVAGIYTLTLTDANGCSISPISFPEITQSDSSLSIQSIELTEALCPGDQSGFIHILSTIGGMPPYTYNWNTGEATSFIDNLSAGIYDLTITDDEGCTFATSFTIVQITEALAVASINNHVKCFGENTGSIDLSVQCGTPPYTFEWSNSAETEDIDQLIAGDYTVTVTDSLDLQIVDTFTINQPNSPLIIQEIIIDYDSCLATAEAIVSGSIENSYSYLWADNNNNPLSDENVVASLEEGTYHLSIEDINHCQEDTTFIIPAAPMITSVVISSSNDGETISLSVEEVEGGTPPFAYTWLDEDDMVVGLSATVNNLPIGTYTLLIEDNNGCEFIEDMITPTYDVQQIEHLSLSPNPVSNIANLAINFTENVDVSIEIVSVIGQKMHHIEQNNVSTLQQTLHFSAYPSGIYFIIIKINNAQIIVQKLVKTSL